MNDKEKIASLKRTISRLRCKRNVVPSPITDMYQFMVRPHGNVVPAWLMRKIEWDLIETRKRLAAARRKK
jgi:hypothetical protein